VDKNEVFLGVDQYCEAREIVFDSRVITQLWSQVDDNGDGVLDRHEFAVFLARYCEAVGVGLDDMAFVVLEQLAGVAMVDDSQDELYTEEPLSAWAKLVSLAKKKPRKRQTWAQLKVESERVEETVREQSQSNWDTMKFKVAFNTFQKARDGDDTTKKHKAAEKLWQKVDQMVVSRKKRLEDALDLNKSGNDDKKLLTKAERRKAREQKKRLSAKIQASSLDGFFTSVGDVIEKNKRDRSANANQGASDDAEYNLSPRDRVP
jgi:hypothetical protein